MQMLPECVRRKAQVDEERAEFERLQQISRAAINRTYPRPKLTPDELAVVKQALGIQEDAGGQ